MNMAKRCDGISRRDFLRVGGLTALGLGLGDFFHLQRAFAVGSEVTAKKHPSKNPLRSKKRNRVS